MINRCALIVRPAAPYVEWAAGLDDSGAAPRPDDEPSVYLIPDVDSIAEAWAFLERLYDGIFRVELHGWHTDERAWPRDRTFAMFQEWFDVDIASSIEDLVGGPFVDDLDDDLDDDETTEP